MREAEQTEAPWVGGLEFGEEVRRAVGGAVYHHPDRGVLGQCVAHGLPQDWPGIVARDEDEGLWCGHGQGLGRGIGARGAASLGGKWRVESGKVTGERG